MGEVPEYVIGKEAGFKIAKDDIHKTDSLSFYSDRMNNLPMLMLAGPHGGGGGAYDMAKAYRPSWWRRRSLYKSLSMETKRNIKREIRAMDTKSRDCRIRFPYML